MTNGQNQPTLQHYVAEMVALESQIEAQLDQFVGDAPDHPGAAMALRRFHRTAKAQHDALQTRLLSISGSGSYSGAGLVKLLVGQRG